MKSSHQCRLHQTTSENPQTIFANAKDRPTKPEWNHAHKRVITSKNQAGKAIG